MPYQDFIIYLMPYTFSYSWFLDIHVCYSYFIIMFIAFMILIFLGNLYVIFLSLIHSNIECWYLFHTSIIQVDAFIFFPLFLLFMSGHFQTFIHIHKCFTVGFCVLNLCSWLLNQYANVLFDHSFEINFVPWFWSWFTLSFLWYHLNSLLFFWILPLIILWILYFSYFFSFILFFEDVIEDVTFEWRSYFLMMLLLLLLEILLFLLLLLAFEDIVVFHFWIISYSEDLYLLILLFPFSFLFLILLLFMLLFYYFVFVLLLLLNVSFLYF